jgi:hypothetical protein
LEPRTLGYTSLGEVLHAAEPSNQKPFRWDCSVEEQILKLVLLMKEFKELNQVQRRYRMRSSVAD